MSAMCISPSRCAPYNRPAYPHISQYQGIKALAGDATAAWQKYVCSFSHVTSFHLPEAGAEACNVKLHVL